MKKMFCRLAVLMAEKDPQLSQRQLAKDTGLDITTINRLFTNNFSRVDVGTVENLCNYFGKNIGDLFDMREPEDIPQRKSRKRINEVFMESLQSNSSEEKPNSVQEKTKSRFHLHLLPPDEAV